LRSIEGYQTAEKDVKKQSFMTTFVRPVGFMENFYWPLYVQCVSANWDEKLQYKTVAVDDIGRAVASIFADPKKVSDQVQDPFVFDAYLRHLTSDTRLD